MCVIFELPSFLTHGDLLPVGHCDPELLPIKYGSEVKRIKGFIL